MARRNRINEAAKAGDVEELAQLFARGSSDFEDCMEYAAANGHVSVIEWMLQNRVPRGKSNFSPDVLEAAFTNKQYDVIRFLGSTCSCPGQEHQSNTLCNPVSCTNQFQWSSNVMVYPFMIEEDGIKRAEVCWDVMLCAAQSMPTMSVYKQVLYYAYYRRQQDIVERLKEMNPDFYESFMTNDYPRYQADFK